MEALLPLALLTCPIGMGLMMWFMARGMRRGQTEQRAQDASLPDLKAEQARLAEKIAALEQHGTAGPAKTDETAVQQTPAEVR